MPLLSSAQLSSESSSLMKTRKVPFSPWSPRPAREPPRLSGVYRIEVATLWDLACFHFCSQLSGLHGPHLQVSACPSPTMQSHEAPPNLAHSSLAFVLFSTAASSVPAPRESFPGPSDKLCWSNLAAPFPRFSLFVCTLGVWGYDSKTQRGHLCGCSGLAFYWLVILS